MSATMKPADQALADLMEEGTLAFAKDAKLSVAALLELLRGCKPDYPLSAGLFLGLMVSIDCSLERVVDSLGVALQEPS